MRLLKKVHVKSGYDKVPEMRCRGKVKVVGGVNSHLFGFMGCGDGCVSPASEEFL